MKNRTSFFLSRWVQRLQKPVALMMAFGMMGSPVLAQPPTPVPRGMETADAAVGRGSSEKMLQLNFRDSPLDQVLDLVAELKGRTIIKSPGVNATITLKSQSRLTVTESLQAIETMLAMHNITLVPMGARFLKVVQTAAARQEGMPINIGMPEEMFKETDKLISQVFTLQYVELAEIQQVITGIGLLHGYGKIQPLERANSLMVTDTEANLARITEILEFLDQPIEAKIETRIYEIRFAEASQIAGKLNELIADSQAKEERPQIAVPEAQPSIPTPPGVIRARPQPAPSQAGSEVDAALQVAERGVIRGKVRIIADDRTNILFVISRTENFLFFDRIVSVLDRPIDPAITVRVVALEYAKAEEISGILNEFIGAASADKQGTARTGAPSDVDAGATDSRSQALRDFIRARTEQRPAASAPAEQASSAIGRLSPDTKILADKRTNSLLMMGKLNDLSILEDLIDHLDIMLAQVVIEAVIIEVGLSDEVRSGVDWVQRSMVAYNERTMGPGGGITVREPVTAWGGGTSLGAGVPRDGATIQNQSAIGSGGMNWYMTLFDLNIDAVIRLAQSSRNSQILSTPVIVTTDNTEAKIIASTQRPVVTTTSTTDGGSIRSSYEYRDIGINLTVTPRINPQRVVVMEVNQTADDVAGEILIDGNLVPEITKRELNATIAVGDRNTIVLGGLILTRDAKSETKVPLLGDIPLIGNLFKFKTSQKQRSELVVLLTPYVLMTPAEARAESTRLYSATNARQREWHEGWSDSPYSKMTDRQKREYIREWEKNRPEPYTRDLSINLFEDKSSAKATKPPRRTLMGPSEETPVNVEEPIEVRLVDESELPSVTSDVLVPAEAEDIYNQPLRRGR
ncbi:MAG TPA: type II secretion system secretin GspD [Kiritimatiellia bacterium]|nr:type II secretion system secretin GspD [Kiritimatiellia bacterium]